MYLFSKKKNRHSLLDLLLLRALGEQDQPADQVPLGYAPCAAPACRVEAIRYGRGDAVPQDILGERLPVQELAAVGQSLECLTYSLEFGIGH